MAESKAQMRQRLLRNINFPPGSEERASLDAIGVPVPDPLYSGGAAPFMPVPGFNYPSQFEMAQAARPTAFDMQAPISGALTEDTVYSMPSAEGRAVMASRGNLVQDPSDASYAYLDRGDGSYDVFRGGVQTGTARAGSRAAQSIANVMATGKPLEFRAPARQRLADLGSERERRLEASLASHDLSFERPVVEDRAPMSFAEYSRTPGYQQAVAQQRSDSVNAGLPPRPRAVSKL